MSEIVFRRRDALAAIRQTKDHGLDWLYANYPKPGGRSQKSSTGFLLFDRAAYPVKPLGRLANEISGAPMTTNPTTNYFRKHFSSLGFQLTDEEHNKAITKAIIRESKDAAARQRRLAEVWARRGQAKFRRDVFAAFGSSCLITGCESLYTLEAAHILPVSSDGKNKDGNGIPLRADIHRLFDQGVISIDPDTWQVSVNEDARHDYGEFHGMELRPRLSKVKNLPEVSEALRSRDRS